MQQLYYKQTLEPIAAYPTRNEHHRAFCTLMSCIHVITFDMNINNIIIGVHNITMNQPIIKNTYSDTNTVYKYNTCCFRIG